MLLAVGKGVSVGGSTVPVGGTAVAVGDIGVLVKVGGTAVLVAVGGGEVGLGTAGKSEALPGKVSAASVGVKPGNRRKSRGAAPIGKISRSKSIQARGAGMAQAARIDTAAG